MSRRLDKVNELLKREISQVVQKEYEFTGSLVTITAVQVAPDLRDAKVFVGVLGGKVESILERLNLTHGMIQGKVAKRVVLRCTPVLRFVTDVSVERGVEMVNLLDEVAKLPTAPREEEDEEDSE